MKNKQKRNEFTIKGSLLKRTIIFSRYIGEYNIPYTEIAISPNICDKPSFKERSKRCYKLLFKGWYFEDFIYISNKDIPLFKKWLDKTYKKAETKDQITKELYLPCVCFGETIYFSKHRDEISIEILTRHYKRYRGLYFKERIKRCFNILFKGECYRDQMALLDDKMYVINRWLEKYYK